MFVIIWTQPVGRLLACNAALIIAAEMLRAECNKQYVSKVVANTLQTSRRAEARCCFGLWMRGWSIFDVFIAGRQFQYQVSVFISEKWVNLEIKSWSKHSFESPGDWKGISGVRFVQPRTAFRCPARSTMIQTVTETLYLLSFQGQKIKKGGHCRSYVVIYCKKKKFQQNPWLRSIVMSQSFKRIFEMNALISGMKARKTRKKENKYKWCRNCFKFAVSHHIVKHAILELRIRFPWRDRRDLRSFSFHRSRLAVFPILYKTSVLYLSVSQNIRTFLRTKCSDIGDSLSSWWPWRLHPLQLWLAVSLSLARSLSPGIFLCSARKLSAQEESPAVVLLGAPALCFRLCVLAVLLDVVSAVKFDAGCHDHIDHRCEYGRFAVSASCVEWEGLNMEWEAEKALIWLSLRSESRCGICFTKKWRAETLQPGLQFDNFKPSFKAVSSNAPHGLTVRFLGHDRAILTEGVKTLSNGTNFASQLATFLFCLHIYSLWSRDCVCVLLVNHFHYNTAAWLSSPWNICQPIFPASQTLATSVLTQKNIYNTDKQTKKKKKKKKKQLAIL